MLGDTAAFSGYSVTDIDQARSFYADTLGIKLEEQAGMGFRMLFPNGQTIFIYPKPNHVPAEFTVLNFPVADIDAAVDELVAKGIVFEHYDNMPATQDDKQILRGKASGYGPDIAWFKDPSGNILSILQD